MRQRVLVTGGAGFIGSHLVDLLLESSFDVLILDALSWGSNLKNLPPDTKIVGGISGQMVSEVPEGPCVLVVGDVADAKLVGALVNVTSGVFHLAAQSHVDRSYGDVLPFVNSNMVGAYAVLEAVRAAKHKPRCVFVSTDEVYGDVETGFSSEVDPLAPRNIYSALKAGGDLLAQTYAAIFNLNIVIARPANNYGPRQFEEKLIPRVLTTFLSAKGGYSIEKVPIYGDGKQTRDWLYVKDTAKALWLLFERGRVGNIYNLGAHQFRTVLEVVQASAAALGVDWERYINHVADRIRGDRRYALNLDKTDLQIGWCAKTSFEEGLRETVKWYSER